MMNTFLSIAVCLLWLTVVNHAKMVLQSPDDLMKNQNELAVFTCSHNIQDYNRMLWYKQSHMSGLTLMGYLNFENENIEPEFENKIKLEGNAKKSGNLTIKNLRLGDSAVYFCAAYYGDYNSPAHFGDGTKLTVLDPKIKVSEEQDLNVTIIKPSEKESCKKTVTLVCVAKDFYPDHVSITWMVGGKPRTEGVATDPNAFREQETEHFTISSRLKVPRKEWNNEKTEFKCTLKFYDGKDYLYKENKVNGIAGSGYTREDYVKSSQMIKLSYGVFIAKSALYGLVIFVYVWRKGSGK